MLSELAATVAMGCLVYMPNLCLKDGVRINGGHFEPEIVRILDAARDTAPMMERGTVWITSANDARHNDDSLHYKDKAFDIRIFNIIGDVHREAKLWAERMQEVLGSDYDVIYEKTHIHVEFQPDVAHEEEPEEHDGFDYDTG